MQNLKSRATHPASLALPFEENTFSQNFSLCCFFNETISFISHILDIKLFAGKEGNFLIFGEMKFVLDFVYSEDIK